MKRPKIPAMLKASELPGVANGCGEELGHDGAKRAVGKAHERKAQSHHNYDPGNAGSEEWRE